MRHLDAAGEVARVSEPVDIVHDMAEVHRRVIARDGPALVFECPRDASGRILPVPVVANLFGTRARVAAGLGIRPERLAELGEALASLREPQPVDGLRDALARLPILRAAMRTRAEVVDRPPAQDEVRLGRDVDLAALPVQTCWPGEAGPLITWGVVVTRPPDQEAVAGYNLGIYRMQVLGRDRVIMRWLHHRGGAKHHAQWAAQGQETPVAVAIGTDPATMLSAVLPLPETLSEVRFSGLLRGARPRLAKARTVPLMVPADSEIVLEGFVSPTETAPEGPFGDHTGYYNSVEPFPVMRVTAITTRRDPSYLSTLTGRAPDEPAVLGATFNELFLPIVKRAFPEIVDVWLPPHACSYRMAIISIRKRYPGHARRIMMGLWGMLPQFTYTKLIVVVDDDVDPKSWDDVAWAISTRFDASRDLMVIDRTPIDYLDFASPLSGLGGKLGLDATNKIGTETSREWGQVLKATPDLVARVDALWPKLGL
ncbi:UbiD family decarboxylase [Rhodoplanes sp. TEM]|uniref:UbiD family decarboxylase n=1 Tax=Rhodoplanes tepidamans TaxID=200616 RepID=A0ABT5J9J6_RHOTP|nr:MULTISPECIES: UbiD family decarboxylase [Rhodoplanes]MDC7786081.1 UbiD family decarboxylase [Rhodoplanes tepidamans]MDC7985645.1 UbiD family decarboxylase [Rhodoplanes sp. TEM]